MRSAALLLLALLLALPAGSARREPTERPPLVAQRLEAEPLAIVGGTIHPVTRPDIERGILLLRDGRIEAVQPEGSRIPAGYRVIDAAGRHVYPGLVALGASGIGLAPDAWDGGPDAMLNRGIAESFDPWSDAVELAASGGITSALVRRAGEPAKGPLSGRGAVLKMSVREPRGVLVEESAAAFASGALLTPAGRRQLHEMLEAARKERKPGKPGSAEELVQRVARGKVRLVAGFDAAGDITSLLDLARAEDLKLLLLSPAEAWPLAETLAKEDVAVGQHVRYSWGKPRDDRRTSLPGGARFDAAARLRHAGVETAVVTLDDDIFVGGIAGRDLLDLALEAAFAQRGGLTAQEALEGITIVPARILGLDQRLGSLEPGKDADVVIADGDLLDYRTFVRTTIVNGRVAYEAATSRWWRGIIAARDAEASSDASP